MKLQVHDIELVTAATTRRIVFDEEFNIVAGPTGTGKTTLFRLLYGLIGGKLDDLAEEVRDYVPVIQGSLTIGEHRARIVRPLKPASTGRVEIERQGLEPLRIPASEPIPGVEQTYATWMLQQLGLPLLRVPKARTDPASDAVALSLNDFYLYCYLDQDDLDKGVFGSENTFKNVKRMYVWEVLYGVRQPEQDELEREYRDLSQRIATLSQTQAAVEALLSGTPWQDRASIQARLAQLRAERDSLSQARPHPTLQAQDASRVQRLQETVLQADEELAALTSKIQKTQASIPSLELLVKQLDTQVSRVVRSIVAQESFAGFEFFTCPRCAANIDPQRGATGVCALCQQPPAMAPITRETLVLEQERLEDQILETTTLIESHRTDLKHLADAKANLVRRRDDATRELNEAMQNFVSEEADNIAANAAERARVESELARFSDYEELYRRRDAAAQSLAGLQDRRNEIERRLEELKKSQPATQALIADLEQEFARLVAEMEIPGPANPRATKIDRKTLLPLAHGQKLSELSQGTTIMVHVAYAIAHHRNALRHNLPLPGILLIDGLTDNLGDLGNDEIRIGHIYRELAALAAEGAGRLQVIVGDNRHIQPEYEPNIQLMLTEDDKLVPVPPTPPQGTEDSTRTRAGTRNSRGHA